jgi:hypothetical protein
MNTFGLALFQQPEEFIALHLGINIHLKAFAEHLEQLLQRSKSPPLALVYTCRFLRDKSEEELSLDVVRFVSQLADVSPGVSMSGSLHGILTESAFLTELRHNLTHKTMVKGSILALARQLILQELEDKYWKVGFEKVKSTYRLKPALVQEYYQRIYGCSYEGNLEALVMRHDLDYFLSCSNYEFKEHIATVIAAFGQGKVSSTDLTKYHEEVGSQKQIIFVVVLLQTYLSAES